MDTNQNKDNSPSPKAINEAMRKRVLRDAVPVWQKVASFTQGTAAYVAGQALVLNTPLVNVGLIRRLIVKVTANIQQSAAETHTRSNMGPANFLSQIVLTDLNNQARINTSGWHLAMLGAARHSAAFGTVAYGAAVTTDSPLGFGANYNIISAPASFTAATNMYMMYEIPISYSDTDLRGAIFANVVNATMNLQLTVNPNFSVASTGDDTQACYKSSAANLAKINSYTIDVYQEYLDQLPRDNSGKFMLPQLDLSTQYSLLSVTNTGLIAAADYSLPYANFRQYLSTFVYYDNGGTVNAGTDINYFALQTANSMNLLKYDPFISQLLNGRFRTSDDWPKGMYYFDHRQQPISTNAFGNMQLLVNPATVNSNAQLIAGYEYFSNQQLLKNAGSMVNT